jgi:hypothetical protein
VRLDVEKPKSGKIAKNTGGEAVPTEEISIDFSGPGSAVIKGGSSSKLSAPKSTGKLTSDSGKSLANPGSGDSSEFELSLDEAESTPRPTPSDSDCISPSPR